MLLASVYRDQHLRAAAALDPARFGDKAADQIRAVRTTTHGCALSPP